MNIRTDKPQPAAVLNRLMFLLAALIAVGLCSFSSPAFALTATTTTVTLTANGAPVTTIPSHTVVTLTATVKAGSTALTLGQVSFCDAASKYCEDSHLLGTAQLTAAATATIKFVPGYGDHSYKAIFVGTQVNPASSSAVSSLTVSATFATKTSIKSSGSGGSYTLSADVTSIGATVAPTGTVFFQNKSDSDAVLGQGVLGPGSRESVNWRLVPSALSEIVACCAVTADLNGDGYPDVVNTNRNTGGLTVLLSNGDGTFTAAEQPVLSLATYLATGDFNGDGKVDLAVISELKTLTILLGHGDGTFDAGTSQTIYSSSGIVAADFNGDGVEDLALYDYAVRVFFGKGDGTFAKGINVGGQGKGNNHPLYVGDYNGDGKPDLLTSIQSAEHNGLTVLLNGGGGTFTQIDSSSIHFPAGDEGVVQGDFNNDGRTDLASHYSLNSKSPISILLANADGSFTPVAVKLLNTIAAAEMVDGDFNGDGNLDLAVESFSDNSGPVFLLLGDGTGSFTQAKDPMPTITQTVYLVVAADFDGDGTPDLLKIWSPSVVLLNSPMRTATVSASGRAPAGVGTNQVVARYQGSETFLTSGSAAIPLKAPAVSSPIATLSKLLLQFSPEQPLTALSNAQTVLLTNTGKAPLIVSGMAIVPEAGKGASFATSNDCPTTLGVGAACKIRVRFVPSSAGTKTTQLVITDNAGNSPQSITLTGGGAGNREATLSATSLNFPNQPLHVASPVQTITLTNTGTAKLFLNSFAFSGDTANFIVHRTCGKTLAAGDTCSISVGFTPNTLNYPGYIYQATIAISSNASDTPRYIGLTGTILNH